MRFFFAGRLFTEKQRAKTKDGEDIKISTDANGQPIYQETIVYHETEDEGKQYQNVWIRND
jgi:hypothetical protein